MSASEVSTERVALNADVVGYSKLMADDFEATTAVMEDYRRIVTDRVAEVGGGLITFAGDNFMAVFDDVRTAVQAAIKVSGEVESRNVGLPLQRQARFRMGIDQGEIVESDGQYFGDALNIAARVQSLAPAGGLSVSGKVFRELDEPALRFRPLGRQRLKNIPEEVDVYEFADLPTDRSSPPPDANLALESPTVAVLPIHVETESKSLSRTAGVVRADIIHRLSQIPQLKVIDSGAAPPNGGTSARYMVESGVHQSGDRVRVYATLFDVTTFNIIKSHKWTTTADELFELSETVANDVANTIEIDLIVGEPSGIYAELNDPEATHNVNMGWYHLTTNTPEGWLHSLEYFDKVVKADPEMPTGHVLLSYANWTAASNGWTDDTVATMRLAREQARTAMDLGDPTGMSIMLEAAVLTFEGKGEEAISLLDQVEIIRPTCDATFALEGSVRRYMGQWDQAIERLDRAMRLTGVNKPWYPTVKACSLFHGGRVDQAASMAEAVLEHQPNNLEALLILIAAEVELGLDRRARANADLVRERFPTVDVHAWLDRSPYDDRNVVEKWKAELAKAGVLESA